MVSSVFRLLWFHIIIKVRAKKDQIAKEAICERAWCYTSSLGVQRVGLILKDFRIPKGLNIFVNLFSPFSFWCIFQVATFFNAGFGLNDLFSLAPALTCIWAGLDLLICTEPLWLIKALVAALEASGAATKSELYGFITCCVMFELVVIITGEI